MNKLLIILVAILLLVSLYFNYSMSDSMNFLTSRINWLADIGTSVAEISGIDTNATIPYFLQNLNTANLGSYYSENTGIIYNVRDVIKSYLPTWLKVADPKNCKVQVYTTFYSAEFECMYTEMMFGTDLIVNNTVYTLNRIVRLGVTYYDVSGRTYIYDVYMYKNPNTNIINFFCTSYLNSVGYNSTQLNSYFQMKVQTRPGKPLNSQYIIQLRPDIVTSNTTMYVQDSIIRVQDTTDPLWIDFSDFIEE